MNEKTPQHENEEYHDSEENFFEDDDDSPTLFLDGNDTFNIIHPIGTFYLGMDIVRIIHPVGTFCLGLETLPLLKASHIAADGQDRGFVSLKYTHKYNNRYDCWLYAHLSHGVERNKQLPDHVNLLGITTSFSHNGYYCVVFPLMEMGSVRSIMSGRFPSGLPEPCILLVLSDILNGLAVIHGAGHVHTQIDAGNIFVNRENEIKLAYSASIYDMGRDSSYHYLSYLAAAPEVHGFNDDPFVYTEKTDIWAIGITALELGYGELKVTSREELEMMAKEINTKQRLPKKPGENVLEADDDDDDDRSLYCFGGYKKKKRMSSNNYTKLFSRGFECMVAKCLDKNPAKRPTVDELLRCGIFDCLSNSGGIYRRYAYDLLFKKEKRN